MYIQISIKKNLPICMYPTFYQQCFQSHLTQYLFYIYLTLNQTKSLIYLLFYSESIKCLLHIKYFWLDPLAIVSFIIFIFCIFLKTLTWTFQQKASVKIIFRELEIDMQKSNIHASTLFLNQFNVSKISRSETWL